MIFQQGPIHSSTTNCLSEEDWRRLGKGFKLQKLEKRELLTVTALTGHQLLL